LLEHRQRGRGELPPGSTGGLDESRERKWKCTSRDVYDWLVYIMNYNKMLFQTQRPGSLHAASNVRLLHSTVIVLRGSKCIQTPIGLRYGLRNALKHYYKNISSKHNDVKKTALSRSHISVVSAASSGTEVS
jgi:hypothetical protein